MPYIHPDKRANVDSSLETIAKAIGSEGELNYCIYKLSCLLAERLGPSYDTLSLCSSAMEHAKLEWYRRKLVPYEEEKIRQNGDI
jgi:hypothetical protein